MLVNTAGIQSIKDRNTNKNRITKVIETDRQVTVRRNKLMAHGKVDGKYVTGGSVCVGASHQRIAAWKRDAA